MEPPVAPPKTIGASPPMAVPSVQGFAQWNLERCPEVLEAAGGLREKDVDLVGLGRSKGVNYLENAMKIYHVQVRWFGGLRNRFCYYYFFFLCCYSLICLLFFFPVFFCVCKISPFWFQ